MEDEKFDLLLGIYARSSSIEVFLKKLISLGIIEFELLEAKLIEEEQKQIENKE